ncbi:MAG: hypothetical protein GY721_08775, partial [Deltaproteobacteria bacterium]|nr:hypothetical protein [Deltaproteobacteria bacterium]
NGVDIHIVENIMPEVNLFAIETVNETIRELFQTLVIRAKGFDVAEEYMSARFIPTPRAAFLGVNLLARGYGREEGIGSIVTLDVGGATTDLYSNVSGNPLYIYPWNDPQKRQKRTILKTPNVPLAYRRVEGKYGLAYDAEYLVELERYKNGAMQRDLNELFHQSFPDCHIPEGDPFNRFLIERDGRSHDVPRTLEVRGTYEIDLDNYLTWIHDNPHHLPAAREEDWVRAFLASEVMRATTKNNVGYVKETDVYFLQYGVNFLAQETNVLLIGGAIYGRAREGKPEHFEDLRMISPKGPSSILKNTPFCVLTEGFS